MNPSNKFMFISKFAYWKSKLARRWWMTRHALVDESQKVATARLKRQLNSGFVPFATSKGNW